MLRRWLPLFLWMLLIFAVSGQPKSAIADFGVWDLLVKKGSHVLAYAVLAVLASRALPRPGYAILWALAYAVTDELHQRFVPGRMGSPVDVLIDGLGILLGVGVLWLWRRSRHRSAAAPQSGQKAPAAGPPPRDA